jgi:hypothetical protein
VDQGARREGRGTREHGIERARQFEGLTERILTDDLAEQSKEDPPDVP